MNRFMCAFLLIAAVACNKEKPDPTPENPYAGYKEYIIPANEHYPAKNDYPLIQAKAMHFLALFDSSCIYTNRIPENIYDINKLYGFSDCGSLHQSNSARVGWLWNGKKIELHAYCYKDNVRSSILLGTTDIGKPVDLSISVSPNQYNFTFNGTKTTMARTCTGDNINGYKLLPYFGGDETAPHEIHIFIKDL